MTRKLTILSGLGVKGPACFLFETNGLRIMLDLGRGPDKDALPDLSGLGHVDAILFSHGHVDHTGGLHLAAALGHPPLFAPAPTIALSTDPAMQRALPYDALEEILGLPFASGPTGHAPGASWIRIGGASGLLYGGDSSEESPLWRFTPPPRAEVAILDASYGTADVPLAEQVHAFLALADRPLLLPAPAGGRGVEMALAFLRAGHEIALCPAHLAVIRQMLGQSPGWLTEGGPAALAALLAAARPLTAESPARGVMIGAGPNAERGVTAVLAPRFLAEGRARVVFSGHLAAGAPAASWVARGQARFLRWNVHPTLTGLRHQIRAAAPRHIVAAFCTDDARHSLAAALGRPLLNDRSLIW